MWSIVEQPVAINGHVFEIVAPGVKILENGQFVFSNGESDQNQQVLCSFLLVLHMRINNLSLIFLAHNVEHC